MRRHFPAHGLVRQHTFESPGNVGCRGLNGQAGLIIFDLVSDGDALSNNAGNAGLQRLRHRYSKIFGVRRQDKHVGGSECICLFVGLDVPAPGDNMRDARGDRSGLERRHIRWNSSARQQKHGPGFQKFRTRQGIDKCFDILLWVYARKKKYHPAAGKLGVMEL